MGTNQIMPSGPEKADQIHGGVKESLAPVSDGNLQGRLVTPKDATDATTHKTKNFFEKIATLIKSFFIALHNKIFSAKESSLRGRKISSPDPKQTRLPRGVKEKLITLKEAQQRKEELGKGASPNRRQLQEASAWNKIQQRQVVAEQKRQVLSEQEPKAQVKVADAQAKEGRRERTLESVKNNPKILAGDLFADLRKDKTFMLEAIKENVGAFVYSDADLLGNDSFITQAVKIMDEAAAASQQQKKEDVETDPTAKRLKNEDEVERETKESIENQRDNSPPPAPDLDEPPRAQPQPKPKPAKGQSDQGSDLIREAIKASPKAATARSHRLEEAESDDETDQQVQAKQPERAPTAERAQTEEEIKNRGGATKEEIQAHARRLKLKEGLLKGVKLRKTEQPTEKKVDFGSTLNIDPALEEAFKRAQERQQKQAENENPVSDEEWS